MLGVDAQITRPFVYHRHQKQRQKQCQCHCYGHAVGDNVIRALANLLRQRLRRVDSLGRYGGEEFLAVLPDCNGVQAVKIIDQIRQQFSLLSFVGEQGEFFVSLSAGVACCMGSTANEVMETADRALYNAKRNGRNRVLLSEC